ncbi:hypothetical protein BJY00DRAFT_315802 [Aspergillus carlsbadensis]|nr:hypothetical protein BJY00DRAFT_315802 [Aspergillus carlsbadensis]
MSQQCFWVTYAKNDPTQLIGITNGNPNFPPPVELAYDANGCLIRDEKGRTLEYDSGSRLQAVRDKDGPLISQSSYEAGGRLICQSIPDQPDTYLFYRDDKIISSKTGDSRVSYLSDGQGYWGQTVQTNDETQTQLWATNSDNSVLAWIDPTKPDEVHPQQYTPYGLSAQESAPSIGFNGQWRDPVTGWYHLGNGYRVYIPVLCRFHVPNPNSPFATGEIISYAYCAGNPVNRIDPNGQGSVFSQGYSFKDFFTMLLGFIASVFVAVLTAGASLAIQIGVGIAVGVASSVVSGVLGDVVEGRKPTWSSVGMDALNGLVGGIIGEAGGQLLSAGFKGVMDFKTLIGRVGSYTLQEVADTSDSAILKAALKDVFPSEAVSNVAGGLLEIDPFPESTDSSDPTKSGTAAGGGSTLTLTSSDQSAGSASTAQQPSRVTGQSSSVRHASLMRDPIRPVLSPGQSTLSRSPGPQSVSSTTGAPNPPAKVLNRQFKFSFGPVGASQGKRQTTGDGGLEALESRRRMYSALRVRIRRQQSTAE